MVMTPRAILANRSGASFARLEKRLAGQTHALYSLLRELLVSLSGGLSCGKCPLFRHAERGHELRLLSVLPGTS